MAEAKTPEKKKTAAKAKKVSAEDFGSGKAPKKKVSAEDFGSGAAPRKRGRPVKQGVATVEELSIDFEEDGKIVRRGLQKQVLSKGAWATVMYLFEDLNRKTGEFGAPKVSITRYRKSNGVYSFQKEFAFSSGAQVKQINEVLAKWLKETKLGE